MNKYRAAAREALQQALIESANDENYVVDVSSISSNVSFAELLDEISLDEGPNTATTVSPHRIFKNPLANT